MHIEPLFRSIDDLLKLGFFFVPRFQRPFSWEEQQIEEFCRTVLSIKSTNGNGCAIRITRRAPSQRKRVHPAQQTLSATSRATQKHSPLQFAPAFSAFCGVVNGDYEQALSHLRSLEGPDGGPWTAEQLEKRMELYHAEHEYIRLDPEARNVRHTYVIPAEDKRSWTVQQVLVDPDEHNDWKAEFQVDLMTSRETGEPALRLHEISSVAR